jgi:hypothetical protein
MAIVWDRWNGWRDTSAVKEKDPDAQTCPSCGLSEPEVTFDADTMTLDCDECVGFRRAIANVYRKLDEQRRQ